MRAVRQQTERAEPSGRDREPQRETPARRPPQVSTPTQLTTSLRRDYLGRQDPDALSHVLNSPGAALNPTVRQDLEARLGADFSSVRVHTDGAAQRSAARLGAQAFTSGEHIVMGEVGADRLTLAHELAHVVQQRQGPVDGVDHGNGLRVSDPDDRHERQAHTTAVRALAGASPDVAASPPGSGDRSGTVVQRVVAITTKPSKDDPEWADDLDDYIAELPEPTPERSVAQLVRNDVDETVVLWHGTRMDRAKAMTTMGTAGGVAADPDVGRPTFAEAKNQAQKGSVMTELTTNPGVSEGFSAKNGALLVVSVSAKYLTKGSASEGGWILNAAAPLEVLFIVDRLCIAPKMKIGNAS